MKQHITVEQLNELSDKAKAKLREWWKPKDGDYVYYDGIVLVFGDSYYSPFGNTIFDYEINKCVKTGINIDKCLPLLNIGQMIEFIEDHSTYRMPKWYDDIIVYEDWEYDGDDEFAVLKENSEYRDKEKELCDLLWEKIKHLLT